MLHSIYDQPDTASVHAQFDRVVEELTEKLAAVAEHLDQARANILAPPPSPKRYGDRSGPTTSNQRLNREIRRRTDVVGIFPDRTAGLPSIVVLLGEHGSHEPDRAATSSASTSPATARPRSTPPNTPSKARSSHHQHSPPRVHRIIYSTIQGVA
jgi:transposase-like protein